jgi:uncharacterized protein (UPF0276 family)
MSKLKKFAGLPYLGFGIGLRTEHYHDLLEHPPKEVQWLEIISEGFLIEGGRPLEYLEIFSKRYPLIPHGVSLSIGSTDPLDQNYLKKLKKLVNKIKAPWFSDHLCWTKFQGHNMHNLIPMPYTKVSAKLIADKVKKVQDIVGRPMLLENVSSYIEFKANEMTEWEFLTLVAEKADCGILLDINNVFFSSFNHEFDAMEYLNNIPPERVIQYHMAGHLDKGDYIIDTHDHDIRREVWDLYQKAIPLFGEVSFLLERDDHIPPLKTLLKELQYAKKLSPVYA